MFDRRGPRVDTKCCTLGWFCPSHHYSALAHSGCLEWSLLPLSLPPPEWLWCVSTTQTCSLQSSTYSHSETMAFYPDLNDTIRSFISNISFSLPDVENDINLILQKVAIQFELKLSRTCKQVRSFQMFARN